MMMGRIFYLLAGASALALFAACEEDSSNPATGPDGGFALPDGSPFDASPADGAPLDGGGGLDGSADAEAPLEPDYFIDPAAGADTNDGKTAATAFKTLCKARDVVQANEVLGLLDGSYDNASQRPPNWNLNPPCGPTFTVPVRIVALNTGKAILKVPVGLTQGGELRGLRVEYELLDSGSVSSAEINMTGGDIVLRDLSFGEIFSPPNAKSAPLVVTGTAKVTMYPGSVTNYTTVPVPNGKGLSFAFVTGGGELTMEGGTIDDSALANSDTFCNPAFEGSGKITLNGMTVRHKGSVVRVTGATLGVTGGTLEDRATPFNVGCLPLIDLVSSANVTLKDTTLGGGTRIGIGSSPTSGGTVSLSNVTVSGFTQAGIDVNANAGQPLALSVRGSTFQGNDIGIRVAGGVTADLGTAQSIGNNTINGNTTRGLDDSATAVVNAAGNVWIANQQGAGGDGKYAPSLQTGPTTGVNYSLLGAAQTLQF
jgi:hypothetical protein